MGSLGGGPQYGDSVGGSIEGLSRGDSVGGLGWGPAISTGHMKVKQYHSKNAPELYNLSIIKSGTNVHKYTTSKRIELESPGWSGLVRF